VLSATPTAVKTVLPKYSLRFVRHIGRSVMTFQFNGPGITVYVDIS
jgi:hypothetical protein